MKAISLLLATMLTGSLAIAQPDFSVADSSAIHFEDGFVNAADLAHKLTFHLKTDTEKARAIFTWIALNIQFDVRKYAKPPSVGRFVAKSDKEMQRKNQDMQDRDAQLTLKLRKGVCQDYSNLYRTMSRAVGLECLTVTGVSRDFFKPHHLSDNPAHAWNVVKINGQWHLLDVTWGAGFVMNGRFVANFSPGYFMTPPAWFAQSHLPNIAEWQLLETPIGTKDFPTQPLINFGQQDFKLLDFSQNIEYTADGLAQLRFKFSSAPSAFMVASSHADALIDFTKTIENGWVVLHFSANGLKHVTIYMGKSNQSALGWLAKFDVN